MSDAAKFDACHHHRAPKLSRKALATAIAQAKDRSYRRGVRWTALRQRALELLLEAGGPVKAYDLVPLLKAGASAAPPTIYRALDTLVDLGVAHRIASLNAYTACHVGREDHSASFLICDCCGGVEEMASPTDEIGSAIKAQSQFRTVSIMVEAHGTCGRCQT